MSAVGHAEAHGHEHHGPPPANVSSRVDARLLGIYLFIASEIMLFGSFFTALFFARVVVGGETWPPEGFHLPVYLAFVNTIILVTSSFSMHWALQSIKRNHRAGLVAGLTLTFLLGLTFLIVKGFEYKHKYDLGHIPGPNFHFEGANADQVEIFISLYFAMTGLHALHMIIGLGLMSVITWMAWKGKFSSEWYTPVEMSGLYWHFVDIVWIYLFPLLYLIDRS